MNQFERLSIKIFHNDKFMDTKYIGAIKNIVYYISCKQ